MLAHLALDKMPHTLLIAKLYAYNISPAACNFIISYSKNRLKSEKVQGVWNEWTIINQVVPQGSVLNPL